MTINTGINPALLRPQTFHVLTYLLGSRALTPLPQRLLLIGIQSAAALAVAGQIISVDDPSQIDAQFGQGSYMALMARKATETAAFLGAGPALFACPLAETTTKRQETITLAGAATADGVLTIRIAGRYINVGVASGTAAAGVATALDQAIKASYQILPVTSGVGGAVVTCTDVCKSVIGVDVTYEAVTVPVGLTVAFAQTVAGAGALDIQTALDASAGQQFDGIAICNHASADITEINTHIASTWAPGEKKPRWFFIGESGSISTATSLATAANHEGVLVINCQNSRSLPCEIAAAAGVLALSKSRPNANYDGNKVPLYPPPIASAYTGAQVETALNAGLTPLTPIVDPVSRSVVEGVLRFERLITTSTTRGGVPFSLVRDFGISRTAWAMARQYDIGYARIKEQAGADGMLMEDGAIDDVRAMIEDIDYAAQDSKWIKNFDNDKSKLQLEGDATTSGRLNVDSSYTIIVGMHQLAVIHRAQLG